MNRIPSDALTPGEREYYTLVALLASVLRNALEKPTSAQPSIPALEVGSDIKACLRDMRDVAEGCLHDPGLAFSSMHVLSAYRDGAFAIKRTALFALAHHERQLAADRSGKTGLPKDVVALMKVLDSSATNALSDVRKWIQGLKEKLGEGGWLDRLLEWTFVESPEKGGSETRTSKAVEDLVGGRAEAEYWASKVIDSWREGVKGWIAVKWD